jgi:nucleoside-diphosphate-sugar epimerase
MKKKILITGGCGYVGSLLIDALVKKNYKITVVDAFWFGNYIKKHKSLKFIKQDLRNINKINLKGFHTVIHLANIANDPSAEINPSISWEINVMASYELIEKAKCSGVKKFIYASSGSVYGVKKEKKVTEDLSLVPISTYNKTKLIFEKILMGYNDKNFKVYCIRPGTVCGISPRIRLDLSVNLLTFSALKSKIIKVFGGKQFRPHIHIKDMIRVYEFFLEKNLETGIYNAAFECFTINKLAKLIKERVKAKILNFKSDDIRSYRLNSDKLLKLGFRPKFSVKQAIDEIVKLYSQGLLKENINNYNLQKMKKLNIGSI